MDNYEKILEGAGPELLVPVIPLIDSNDFPFMEAVSRGEIPTPDNTYLNDVSDNDEPMEYTELIEHSAFVGEYPFNTIIDGITEQFKNYIGTEDSTNYVDIFYNQLHSSYDIGNDDEEEHPMEIKSVLDQIKSEFTTRLTALFEQRLAITMDDRMSEDDIEYTIRRLYEFFILKAKDNFKRVITKDISSKIKTVISDDREFYNTIDQLLRYYSPLIIAITPMQFLRLAGDETIVEMFDSGQVIGNFLKKYATKLYQYEDFKVEIISNIVMVHDVKEEILNGSADANK